MESQHQPREEIATIFDDIERNDLNPRRLNEKAFEYFNRSSDSEVNRIRAMIEAWFKNYPPDHCSEMRANLRQNQIGAFYELYLHEFIRKLGYDIQIHPESEDVTTHPDFKILSDNGKLVYLEATSVQPPNDDASTRAIKDHIYQIINEIQSPDMLFSIELEGTPRSHPPKRKIIAGVNNIISTIDVEKLRSCYRDQQFYNLPIYYIEYQDWRIYLSPIPKDNSKDTRSKDGVIGIIKGGCGEFFSPEKKIAAKIREKGSKYGILNHPFIIAIDIITYPPIFHINMLWNALFGQEYVQVELHEDGDRLERRRRPTGSLIKNGIPSHTNVSGVLISTQLQMDFFEPVDSYIVHNPYTEFRLSEDYMPITQYVPVDGELTKRDGIRITSILSDL